MENSKSRDKVFSALHTGHLLRWEKQLAMRGNARNLTADGQCGEQRLFVTGEFKRFMSWQDHLFPGAKFIVSDATREDAGSKGGPQAIGAFLLSSTAEEITGPCLAEATGTRAADLARNLKSPLVVAAMRHRGWVFVQGMGRGNPNRLVRQPSALVA
jgi:hypothetical protein